VAGPQANRARELLTYAAWLAYWSQSIAAAPIREILGLSPHVARPVLPPGDDPGEALPERLNRYQQPDGSVFVAVSTTREAPICP